MKALRTYFEIFKAPGALRLIISAFPARCAYGMVSLSIYFKVHQDTGSIAIAGVAAGLNGLAGATTAGIRGAIIDKFGMIWPLRILVPSYAFMITIFSFGSGKTIPHQAPLLPIHPHRVRSGHAPGCRAGARQAPAPSGAVRSPPRDRR